MAREEEWELGANGDFFSRLLALGPLGSDAWRVSHYFPA